MDIKEILLNKHSRISLVKESIYFFSLYYFPHYWTHSSPDFHKEISKEIDMLGKGKYNYLVLCGFRWSGKTSWAKMDLIRQIVFSTKRMCLFVSYDESTAKDNLFDVALELQTNKRLIRDFGQLYFGDESNVRTFKRSQKTWVWNFLTRNWVRVQASSVKKTIRGKVFSGSRPDYVIADDFENNDTKKSVAKTRRVIDYFDEMFGWLSPSSSVIFCCNKISDTGSVAWLYDKFENNNTAKVYEKAVVENDIVQWDRFVKTDVEQALINNTLSNKQEWVVSLESLQRTMNSDGRKVYEQEMLNQPLVDWNRFFSLEYVDAMIGQLKDKAYDKDGNWKVWAHCEPWAEYVIWVDVSEWYWLDSSVIQVINLTNGEQVAEYVNNYADPEELSNEVIDAHNNYNNCLIIPERNSVWSSLIALLKSKWYSSFIPMERKEDAVKKVVVEKYGWSTNKTTKPMMLFDFRESFENDEIKINSIPLLREMRSFCNLDMRHKSFDPEDTLTRHYDRVMAICIANQGKYYKWRSFGVVKKWIKVPFNTGEWIRGSVL